MIRSTDCISGGDWGKLFESPSVEVGAVICDGVGLRVVALELDPTELGSGRGRLKIDAVPVGELVADTALGAGLRGGVSCVVPVA